MSSAHSEHCRVVMRPVAHWSFAYIRTGRALKRRVGATDRRNDNCFNGTCIDGRRLLAGTTHQWCVVACFSMTALVQTCTGSTANTVKGTIAASVYGGNGASVRPTGRGFLQITS